MKIVKIFQPKIVIFTAVKYRCILHGNVFVMVSLRQDCDPGEQCEQVTFIGRRRCVTCKYMYLAKPRSMLVQG